MTTDDAPGNSGHEEDPLVIGNGGDQSSGSSLFKGSESSGGGGGACVIERLGPSPSSLSSLRSFRDWMLRTRIGRFLTQTYYTLSQAMLD